MIFVTVGTQLAFDRLIEAVDAYAGSSGADDVFAQIGPGSFRPRHLAFEPFISPRECRERMAAADAVIAHAGMGTILSALELAKPVVVMPRRADLGEHRNDHQLATAERLSTLRGVQVVNDRHELARALERLNLGAELDPIGPHASSRLVNTIRAFINAG